MTTMADPHNLQLLAELLHPKDEDANEEHEVRELIQNNFYRQGFVELFDNSSFSVASGRDISVHKSWGDRVIAHSNG